MSSSDRRTFSPMFTARGHNDSNGTHLTLRIANGAKIKASDHLKMVLRSTGFTLNHSDLYEHIYHRKMLAYLHIFVVFYFHIVKRRQRALFFSKLRLKQVLHFAPSTFRCLTIPLYNQDLSAIWSRPFFIGSL